MRSKFLLFFCILVLATTTCILYFKSKTTPPIARKTPATKIYPSPKVSPIEISPTLAPTNQSAPLPTSYEVQTTDTTPPVAFILSPENNAHVRVPLKIVANVTDNVKVDRVEFYAGSSDYQHIGTVTEPPYEVMWTPSKGFDGYGTQSNIPIYLKVYDTSGNRGSDQGIAVYLER